MNDRSGNDSSRVDRTQWAGETPQLARSHSHEIRQLIRLLDLRSL
jgi:hypothetical protein